MLRGTLGTTVTVGTGNESYLLFWRKNDAPKWIYLVQVHEQVELWQKFDRSQLSFVHFLEGW